MRGPLTRSPCRHTRSGAITLWMILVIPCLFAMLALLADVSRLWLARIELTNALEAAALSGVKTWAEEGNSPANRSAARADALVAADANTVIGQSASAPADAVPVTLDANENPGADPNDNDSPDGELVLGALVESGFVFTFCSNLPPGGGREFAVRTRKTVTVHSIWTSLFGGTVGPYHVTSNAVAAFRDGQPRIVHMEVFSDACP